MAVFLNLYNIKTYKHKKIGCLNFAKLYEKPVETVTKQMFKMLSSINSTNVNYYHYKFYRLI